MTVWFGFPRCAAGGQVVELADPTITYPGGTGEVEQMVSGEPGILMVIVLAGEEPFQLGHSGLFPVPTRT